MNREERYPTTIDLYEQPIPISMRRRKFWVDELDDEENAIYINLDRSESEESISAESDQRISTEDEEITPNGAPNSEDPKEIDFLTFLATENSNLLEVSFCLQPSQY